MSENMWYIETWFNNKKPNADILTPVYASQLGRSDGCCNLCFAVSSWPAELPKGPKSQYHDQDQQINVLCYLNN
jgi:hypothetical protein